MDHPDSSTWKALIFPVYLPSFLLAFGSGILIPTLPLYARSFDLSFSMISLVVAASSIGTVIGDVPAGILLERIGRKLGMMIGIGIVTVSMVGVGLAQTGIELIIYRGLSGLGMALWQISRHTYITDAINVQSRGRALAIFGGINRIGTFASPALGGVIGAAYGLRLPMFISAGMTAVVLILVIWFIVDARKTVHSHTSHQKPWHQIKNLIKDHIHSFVTAGSAQILVQMIRQGRRLLIPLYAASVIGLDVDSIGLIITAAAAVDMVLFPLAGYIMDHYGRKYAMVPAFLIMGIGTALIPFSSSFLELLAATLLIGFGNGIGSGCMMTLGADLAPSHATGQFLGIWRFIGDIGGVGGPLIVGNFADAFGLSTAAYSLGGIGLLASVTLLLFVRETLEKKQRMDE